MIGSLPSSEHSLFQLLWHAGMIIAYIALLIFLFITRPNFLKVTSGIRSNNLLTTAIILGVFTTLVWLSVASGMLTWRLHSGIMGAVGTIVFLLFIIAPAEEIVFRYFLQNYLANHLGEIIAVVLASIIFGLAHLPNGATSVAIVDWNWKLAGVTFVGGLLFGSVFAYTQNIYYAIVLHAALGSIYFLFL